MVLLSLMIPVSDRWFLQHSPFSILLRNLLRSKQLYPVNSRMALKHSDSAD